jgi:hydrogenase-4 component B
MGCWVAVGCLGLWAADERPAQALGVLGAGLGLAGALWVLVGGAQGDLVFRFWGGSARLAVDALSAAFLVPLHLVALVANRYGADYLPLAAPKGAGRWARCFLGVLVAALTLVFTARQGMLFLMGWEIMAISALGLIATEHGRPEVLRASWVYLCCTHLGTLVLIAMVVLLAQRLGGYAWLPVAVVPAPGWDLAILGLAIIGFGFKAGLLPMHFWLPSAHAGAPSHVSAILSAVMLKAGIYGILRISTLVAPAPHLGGGLMALGAATALYGAGCALAQRDCKRLLAYSSIENIGIITLGIGLGLAGRAAGLPWLAALGFGGAIFHVWNHAVFKALLFLGAGSLLHGTGTRDLEAMGGLAKRMPRTALAVLPGVLAAAALPPFCGFLSEWFLYRGLFTSIMAGNAWPAGLALFALALTGGLAGIAFAKFYGFAFLGLPRSAEARDAHESPRTMWLPMAGLAGLCLALSLGAVLLLPVLDRIVRVLAPGQPALLAAGLTHDLGVFTLLALLLIALGGLIWFWQSRLAPVADPPGTWDCGYARPTVRMEYTAGSFAEGWSALVPGVSLRVRRIRELFPRPTTFSAAFQDRIGEGLVATFTQAAALRLQRFRRLQQGHLSVYLLYILLALVGIFLWAMLRPRLLG